MIRQVKSILFHRILRQFVRYSHHGHPTPNILYPLESRRVLKIAGVDSAVFLQGLITNDMRHLEDGARSMYAMFLNNKGRVLYDTLVHRTDDEDAFLIECDKNTISPLMRYLKLFKLRRKVEIIDVSRDYKLWAFIAPPNTLQEYIDPETNVNIMRDPRLPDLGYRIVCPDFVKKCNILRIIGKDSVIEDSENGYKCLRYMLGVSEGPEDLQPGISFPLEANSDYLHGVSFHKGCYIGQELTARVYHTGVVRKRIMPVIFNEDKIENLPINSVISDPEKPKSNLGKLRAYINNYGLALIRIKEAMAAKTLNVGKYQVQVVKPVWWPMEAPKEKAGLNKPILE